MTQGETLICVLPRVFGKANVQTEHLDAELRNPINDSSEIGRNALDIWLQFSHAQRNGRLFLTGHVISTLAASVC